MSLFSLAGNKSHGLRHYSKAFVFVNGSLLTQETSVTVNLKSNSTPQYTLALGFAGLSQGAGVAEVSIENAIPSADFEFNPDWRLRRGEAVEIGIVMAGQQLSLKGFVESATFSHAVNDASKLSIQIVCRLNDFE